MNKKKKLHGCCLEKSEKRKEKEAALLLEESQKSIVQFEVIKDIVERTLSDLVETSSSFLADIFTKSMSMQFSDCEFPGIQEHDEGYKECDEIPKEHKKSFIAAWQVADILNISCTSVYRLAKIREIPSIRIGRKIMFFEEDILSYLNSKSMS